WRSQKVSTYPVPYLRNSSSAPKGPEGMNIDGHMGV
ncbi:hypothetical protein I315_05673, partial [Cryptococcus gattii Ru294]